MNNLKGFAKIGELGKTIKIGFPKPSSMRVELPVQLREGVYDVLQIGAYTYLGGGRSWFRHVESIGRFCLIARDVVMGSVEHPLDILSPHPLFAGKWEKDWPQLEPYYKSNSAVVRKVQERMAKDAQGKFKKIKIGNDVWIGEGVFIRRGVTVGDGAVIAARAFVNEDVPPYAIVAGTPARVIRYRFESHLVNKLMQLRWWDYGLSALDGVDICEPAAAIIQIEKNILSGFAVKLEPTWYEVKAP